ncbi:uncharacterized protein BDV14DRAFT_119762 [Aspergillus stella-maris]|uniref:uncharacterized protein n=1 Tax=Aspergillus stella-maris TaxID=1810926 RepID=UPI003CCE2DAB
MSSKISSTASNEEIDTTSGYEADISDEISDSSPIVKTKISTSSNSTIGTNNENNELETGIITIACDARDAGPGVRSDDDAQFGTIWIECSARDMGFDNYQAFLSYDSEDEGETEHIEDIGALADREDAGAGPSDSSSRESSACKQDQVAPTSSLDSASFSPSSSVTCSSKCCCS